MMIIMIVIIIVMMMMMIVIVTVIVIMMMIVMTMTTTTTTIIHTRVRADAFTYSNSACFCCEHNDNYDGNQIRHYFLLCFSCTEAAASRQVGTCRQDRGEKELPIDWFNNKIR